MREDTAEFAAYNEAPSKSTRYVVAHLFDVASVYCTSHDDIPSVPGVVIENVIRDPSAISQRIVPDEGRSEIGTFEYEIVDLAGAFTAELRGKLDDDESFRGKRVQLWIGYEGLDFTSFQLFQTQVVKDLQFNDGVYSIQCNDITREQRTEIDEPKKTTLRDSVSESATTIPVYDTTGFETVEHGSSYSDGPNVTVGYFKLEEETIRYTGKTADTFTDCTRGVLNTKAVRHDVDAGSDAERRPKVEEVIYLELPGPKLAYAILTGVLHGDSASLPDHWHCGIDTSLVRLSDFTGIGPDLWDTSLDTAGLVLRYAYLTKDTAKKFLESQVYPLLGCYSPIYSDGTIGLKRMNQVLANAAYVLELNTSNVVSAGPLKHDFSGMHNRLRIDWNWNGKEFTRTDAVNDTVSRIIYGDSEIKQLQFKGLHGSRHTAAVIRSRMDAFRDRYSAPPQLITVRGMPSIDRVEVGDIVRLRLPNVRDYAGAITSIDRSFEIQRKSQRHSDGDLELDLFGSTAPASVEASDSVAVALPDAFYTSAGTELSTVVDIDVVGDVGVIQPGTYDLTGHADMNHADAIYYYDGALELANGATLTINDNVQIRAKGFFTVNGTINGAGRGKAGVADASGWNVTTPGTAGYVGHSRGMDGFLVAPREFPASFGLANSAPAAFTQGQFSAFPFLELSVSGNTLSGIPSDLRGTSGGGGGKIGRAASNFLTGTVTTLGGTGADSGAGLCIVSRGLAPGASASIDLSGDDAAATSVTNNPWGQGGSGYAGAGGAGGPGALLILLDGSTQPLPDIGGKFIGACGSVPINGTTMPIKSWAFLQQLFEQGWADPVAGYADPAMISNLDLSNVAFRIQYIPGEATPQEDQELVPPAPSALSVSPGDRLNTVRVTLGGPLAANDFVEVYASLDNNRANATRVAFGAVTEFTHDLPSATTNYYWTRIRREVVGPDVFSDFFPLGANAGISSTTLNAPGAVFLETWDHQNWEALYNNRANGGGLVVTYPSDGENGAHVLQAAGARLWIAHKGNIPYDPNVLYRITARVRRTAAGGGTGFEYCYVGVEGVAADGVTLINEDGIDSAGSQHYNCFDGFDLSAIALNQWVTATGYFKGHGATPGSSSDISTPTVMRTGVRYFRPLVILNLDNGNGTQQCDFIQVDAVNPLDVAFGGELTNESVATPADAAGNVITYAGAAGTFRARYGTQPIASAAVAFSVVANPQALTVSIDASGNYAVTGGFNAGEEIAAVTFRATFLGSSIDRVLTLTKAKQGATSWTPVLVGVSRNGQTFTKTGGADAWDSAFYSQEGYEGCFVTFQPSQTNLHVMVGLNTDPSADHTYTSLDHAWYPNADGDLYIYESGTLIQSLGAYSANEQLTILYNRIRVEYYRGTTLIRSVIRVGARFFVDSSFYNAGAAVNSVAFGPLGPAGASSGNLLRLDAWTVGALSGPAGNFTLNQSTSGENQLINGVGPTGASQVLWECRCQDPGTGTGGEANGGWSNTGDLAQIIDATKTHRSVVWVRRRLAGTNFFYHGCGQAGDTVNLDGSANSNPYFVGGLSLDSLTVDKWYLSVGIIHGSGYGTTPSGLSGVWDPATGTRVIAGTDYKMAAGARTQEHRAYMFYGGDTTVRMDLADPRFDVVDGTEPSLLALLGLVGTGMIAPNAATEVYSSSVIGPTTITPLAADVTRVTVPALSGTYTAIVTATGDFWRNNASARNLFVLLTSVGGVSGVTGNLTPYRSAASPGDRFSLRDEFSVSDGAAHDFALRSESGVVGSQASHQNVRLQVEIIKR